MQAFRELIKGWLGKILLGLVVLVFGAFGTESLLSIVTKPKPMAEVNGEPITQRSVERVMEYQRQQIRQRLGEKVDPSLLDAERLRPEAINMLVEQALLADYARVHDLGVSKEQISQWLMQIPQFQQDGVFSKPLFDRAVARSGFSASQFYEEMTQEYVVAQVRNSLALSSFLTSEELNAVTQLETQTRDLGYLVLDHTKALDEVEVTDQAVEAYYEAHQAQYKTQEQVRVEYFEVKVSDYMEAVEDRVTEEEIQKAYEADVAALAEDQQRHAAHILIEINDETDDESARNKIDAIAAQLKEGADFGDVAKQASEDKGSAETGGDLGFARRGDFVGPFEDALFALAEGEVSEPIKSEFGYHIIKLIKIKEAEIPAMADVKADLEKRITQEFAEEYYLDQLDRLREEVYDASDLEQPAMSAQKTVQQSEWIPRMGKPRGIFSESQVLDEAFSAEVLKEGYNSKVLEITPNHAVVLRMLEHQEERLRSLSEVRAQVVQAVQKTLAVEKVRTHGQEAIAKLRHGSSLEALKETLQPYLSTEDSKIDTSADKRDRADQTAEKKSGQEEQVLAWREEMKVGRFSSKVDRAITSALFKMPKPNAENEITYSSAEVGDGDFALLRLTATHIADEEQLKTESKMLSRFLTYQLSQFEFQDFVQQLRSDADVVIN